MDAKFAAILFADQNVLRCNAGLQRHEPNDAMVFGIFLEVAP